MTRSDPMEVAGYYLQTDGNWQSACVLSDGIRVTEITHSSVSPKPPKLSASLTGVECAVDVALPMDTLSELLSGPVVSDFRSADIAMGGQGAPLHPFYLHALARSLGGGPIAFLGLEGVTTLIWVDPRVTDPTDPKAIVCFETGPGLDALSGVQASTDKGEVVDGALELFLDDPYFRKLPPKRIERSSFEHLLELVGELSPADAHATLLGMAATSVLLGLEHLPQTPQRFVAIGAGASNAMLMQLLHAALDTEIETLTPTAHGQTIHAQAFAFLAARVAKGLPTTAPNTTGAAAAVGGGNLSDFS